MNKNDLAREIASRMPVTVTMASKLLDTLCVVVSLDTKFRAFPTLATK